MPQDSAARPGVQPYRSPSSVRESFTPQRYDGEESARA